MYSGINKPEHLDDVFLRKVKHLRARMSGAG